MAIPIQKNIIFDEISPVIEYVEIKRNNLSDHEKIIFEVKGEPYNIIKWCRRNFGERGDGWDFSGTGKKAQVTIWSSRLITMYRLWQE